MLCKVVKPDFLEGFQCKGHECSQCCCRSVFKEEELVISKASYYAVKSRHKEPSAERLISRSLYKLPRRTPEAYAGIRLTEEGLCPFYRDSICTLRREGGYSVLPSRCRHYPERFRIVPGVLEKWGELGCCWIADNLVQMKVPIAFDTDMQYVEAFQLAGYRLETPFMELDLPELLAESYWDIKLLGISVLQCRMYSLPDRLILLGLVMWKLGEQELAGNYKRLREQTSEFFLEKFKKSLVNTFRDIRCADGRGFECGWSCCKLALEGGSEDYSQGMEAASEVFQGDSKEAWNRGAEAYSRAMAEYPLAEENLITAMYYSQLQPFFVSLEAQGFLWPSSLYMAVLYLSMRVFLTGYVAGKGPDKLGEGASIFVRRFADDGVLADKVLKLALELCGDQDGLAFLTLLIKSIEFAGR